MKKRDERIEELRTDRALSGLTRDEEAELARLAPGGEDDEFELAAAGVALAELGPLEPMPRELAARVEADARAVLATRDRPSDRSRTAPSSAKTTTAAGAQVVVMPLPAPQKRDLTRWTGWAAAAACLLLLAGQAIRTPRTAPAPASPASVPVAAQREALARTPGARRGSAENESGARVEVVWSDVERRGFVHVAGLAPNDPAATQYQAWVVDDARDTRYPVDCGVFDLAASEADLPLAPKLPVTHVSAVVLTREKPGGVVVSEHGDIIRVPIAR